MSETVLTRQEINRRLLRKHHLSSPARLSCTEVLEGCLAVQAQYLSAAADAVALRSSILTAPGVQTELVAARGPLARGWSLRGTMHLARAEDWPLLVGAVGPFQYRDFQRFMERRKGIAPEELLKLEGKAREALQLGSLTREELHGLVPELKAIQGASWGLDIKGLVLRGEVLAGVSETGKNFFYHAPFALSRRSISQAECLAELAGRYLRAYGPVDARDFAHWAGIPMCPAREAFAALEEIAAAVRLEADERDLFMARQDLDALPGGDAAVDCLLAKFDPLLAAYTHGSPLVPAKYRPRVYRQAGQIEGCVVLDGEAAGTWRARQARRGLRLQVEIFAPLTPSRRERVEMLAALLAEKRRCRLDDFAVADA